MKRLLSFLVITAICLSLCACRNNEQLNEATYNDVTVSTTSGIAENAPEISTTMPPEAHSQRGDSLKSAVIKQLGSGEISGDLSYGSFTYRLVRDADVIYENERTEELENKAIKSVQALVDEISVYYNDEITLFNYNAAQIGTGDSGIDSVRYEFAYINTQNQILTVYADSDGVISYADCDFTW